MIKKIALCTLRWLLRFRLTHFFFSLDSRDDLLYLFACKTSCFQVWHTATPIWARSAVCKLWRQVSTNIDRVMPLEHRSAMPQNFSTNILINSPFFCFMARRVGTDISVSSSKKRSRNSFSKSAYFLIEPVESLVNHSKETPLRVPMNKRAKIASFDTAFSVWDL